MKPDKRRVFAVGAPARRSRDGDGKIAAPCGAGNRPARFRAAKWSRTATSAALLHAGQTSARRAGRGFRGMRTETEGRCRNDIG